MIGLRSKTPIRNDPRCTTARPPAQEGHRENRHRSATDGSRLWNSPGLPVLPKPSAQTAVWHPEMGTLFRRRSEPPPRLPEWKAERVGARKAGAAKRRRLIYGRSMLNI